MPQARVKSDDSAKKAAKASAARRGSKLGLGPEWSDPGLNKFVPIKVLGKGSFGLVVLATDSSNDEQVAIKHMQLNS